MNSGIRLLALLTLIGLSMWLGFLLGKGYPANRAGSEPPPIAGAAENAVAVLDAQSADTTAVQLSTDTSDPAQPPTARQRADAMIAQIDVLASQSDDRVIAEQRTRLLRDLARELDSSNADQFLRAVRHYNLAMPRDGTALLLESNYYQRKTRLRDAIEPLLAAAEFPESNEQLQEIQRQQAELIGKIFEQHAAIDDWLGLTDYLESLLLRAPNNDRIRLYLANAQVSSGDTNAALNTLDVTGTESGVSQEEINELRNALLRSEVEPIRFRAQGDSLIAEATLNSSPIELLVDTGATKTALATDVLRRSGAYPLNRSAQVMTAAGRITAQLYEVPELVIEETTFRNRVVLALDSPPANWDGLLGMDLLREMNVDLSNQLSR